MKTARITPEERERAFALKKKPEVIERQKLNKLETIRSIRK